MSTCYIKMLQFHFLKNTNEGKASATDRSFTNISNIKQFLGMIHSRCDLEL